MSNHVFFRGFVSGIMALAFAWRVYARSNDDLDSDLTNPTSRKYMPYIPAYLLPMFLVGLAIISIVMDGYMPAARTMLSSCFAIFLHISLYYLLLLVLLPFLRKTISARACAMLWLIPNYLYVIHQSYMELSAPALVLIDRWNLVWILFGIWLAGFFGVLLYKCIQHLTFRRRILRDAQPVTDRAVWAAWNTVTAEAYATRPKFQLMVSPAVSTPLTIGLTKGSTRVVLPDQKYSQEELELILRHEIIHIGREDAWNKFFMVFCTAMCWP